MPASKNQPSNDGHNGQHRGDLFCHVDAAGHVDFEIVKAEVEDAPAMLMATLIMSLRLARLINNA